MAKTSTSSGAKAAPKRRAAPESASSSRKAALIKLPGLAATIDDALQASDSRDTGPAEPLNFSDLLQRLTAVHGTFPPVYEQHFVSPFIATLQGLGEAKFKQILLQDPNRESAAGLMLDIAQAVLQHGEGYLKPSTRAFQEFISDLYDGFLSAADRRGVKEPDQGVVPPLAKWGNPDFGPYTWPVDATASFKVQAGVVNMPPANATGGLVSWAALGHETAGHDILHADTGLQDELAQALRTSLAPLGHGLADYWSERIDETASDVMGILNLGPAAGIGLIAYFRALSLAFGGSGKLRSVGPFNDPHPADIVRGYLAAEVVALLKFKGAAAWAKTIAAETDKDRGPIALAGEAISPTLARKSAKVVAATLVKYKAVALENHALGEIQNWADSDEALLQGARLAMRAGTPLPPTPAGITLYAAHLVSAAVIEALTVAPGAGKTVPELQARLVQDLNVLHDQNPSWGPLFVVHPGDLRRDFFVPAEWRAMRAELRAQAGAQAPAKSPAKPRQRPKA
ncbi:hypothetical protein [Aquabacterium sp.]|uniref:hypothetical protein n=1 Tax=Aquabacterium sp. TaxID=1872578 RepID=UPI0024882FD3|nr:hypothetical protein [Aquabacterium sp.]MDI1349832.1 hypothetical protein [Aquabacterium sp.]